MTLISSSCECERERDREKERKKENTREEKFNTYDTKTQRQTGDRS